MEIIVAGTVLLMSVIGLQTHDDQVGLSTAVIPDGSNTVLTVANFTRIQKFILDQGKRETYCNKFNNNPYWAFQEFNAYLNPPDQRNIYCEIGKSEFNILVIQANKPGTDYGYWHILLDEPKKELRVLQYYSKKDPQVLIKEVTEFFQKALKEIDR